MSRFECEAILFDLDGVLVDSSASIERTWKIWAESHGLEAAQIIRVAHGRKDEETLREVASHLDTDAEARKLEQIEIEDAANVRKVEGASELLATLPSGSWAIVTSGRRSLSPARMLNAGWPIPRILVSADDAEKGKPDPECCLKAARHLSIAPQSCVVIEDAPPGIQAARSAGMKVIAVVATHSADDLSAANAVSRALTCIRVERTRCGKPRFSLLVEE